MGFNKEKLFKEAMSFEIVFSSGAEKDFEEAADYYKQIRQGLNDDFVLCLETELEIIKRLPQIYGKAIGEARKTVLHRFPYKVYYIVRENVIIVVAIIHHKRSNRIIKQKLKERK
ncbi:MAG TPA: type II toxin-antitoxin system RelE/ParE family toxin [Bacteroidia bacterium]|nr:type II toxin-antitoxin system RelE/ParE family toxin [Bacteroidia bacterium]